MCSSFVIPLVFFHCNDFFFFLLGQIIWLIYTLNYVKDFLWLLMFFVETEKLYKNVIVF